MEKSLKVIKTIFVILMVLIISLISFVGLFVKTNGKWSNVIADFNYGIELSGFRELRYSLDSSEDEKEVYVDDNGNIKGYVSDGTSSSTSTNVSLTNENGEATEETKEQEGKDEETGFKKETRKIKVNDESKINMENFELAKKIIQNRLEKFSEYEYNIRLDNVNGDLVVELPDDDDLATKQSMIVTRGTLEIIDYQTGVILLDDSYIKNVSAVASTQTGQYQSLLLVEYNEEGREKLKEISNKYQTTYDDAGNATSKYISVKCDNQVMTTTYFGEEITTGQLNIPMGEATDDYDEYVKTQTQAEKLAVILRGETLPLQYTLVSDNYINSEINSDVRNIALIAFVTILVIISIVMIVKFKLKGLIAAITAVGYIALLTLVLKYTNVIVTLNSLIALLITIAVNYVFLFMYFNQKTENLNYDYINAMKKLYLNIIPICIVAIIFTFIPSTIISSIGMVLFWGLFVQAVYNSIIIRVLKIF